MIESEGITEQVTTWRTDVSAKIADKLGIENVMFEAADPPVFGWYVKNFGLEVNLFVDPLPDRAARVPPFRHLGHE